MFSPPRRRTATYVAASAMALALFAACGVQQTPTKSSDAKEAPSSPERSDRATAAAKVAAQDRGPKVSLPSKKVGFLQINAGGEAAARIEQGAKEAAKAIGWSFISCDAQGDPGKMATCGSSLLNQGSNVILSVVIEPAAIQSQLRRAKALGVPWINVGGGVTASPLFTAQYAPEETEMSKLIDKYLVDKITKDGGSPKLAVSTFSSVLAGKTRSDQLKKDLAGTDVKIIDMHESDLTNQIEDARQWATTVLTAHPDVDGFMGTASYSIAITGQVLAAKFPGKSYPDRPLNVGYLDDLANLKAIRDGNADALATLRLDTTSWIAIDQAAELIARKKQVDANAYLASKEVYGLEFRDPVLITKKNLPPAGQYPEPKEDVQTFFKAKWNDEFGTN